MEDNQKFIDQYKSYINTLKYGYQTKEYAGSILIGTNKSSFCENNRCNKYYSQESIDSLSPQTEPITRIDIKKAQDLFEMNNNSNLHKNNNNNNNNNIIQNYNNNQLFPQQIQYRNQSSTSINKGINSPNNLSMLKRWPSQFTNSTSNMNYQIHPGANFNRFNGMNRSFRVSGNNMFFR